MRIWNEMMLCEHPQGAGPLVGAQMRYLIGSAHGWLGGLGFGAADPLPARQDGVDASRLWRPSRSPERQCEVAQTLQLAQRLDASASLYPAARVVKSKLLAA